ncbi:hypothetical protein U9M48_012710 [Paspalum notatum var. saurae]|uniref:Uncharacterized protein n=1 Tax=Paspalum notatum var. saurae TaxID=547442 RepID=A0AAQ3SY31_PASNO
MVGWLDSDEVYDVTIAYKHTSEDQLTEWMIERFRNSRTSIDTKVPGKLQVHNPIRPWEGFVQRHEIVGLDTNTHRYEAMTNWKDSVVTYSPQPTRRLDTVWLANLL